MMLRMVHHISHRPLSPHLQIYRPQMTSALSIFHRISGCFLALGLILVVSLLVAAATGPEAYAGLAKLMASPIGKLALFGWSAALYYHFFNGIRHLIWDTGNLFKIEHATRAGYFVLFCAAFATLATWIKLCGEF